MLASCPFAIFDSGQSASRLSLTGRQPEISILTETAPQIVTVIEKSTQNSLLAPQTFVEGGRKGIENGGETGELGKAAVGVCSEPGSEVHTLLQNLRCLKLAARQIALIPLVRWLRRSSSAFLRIVPLHT